MKRDANHVTHRLAKFSLCNQDSIWIEDTPFFFLIEKDTPPCIVDILASDMRGF